MPVRKKEEIVEPFDYERARRELVETMTSFHLMRTSEMPGIALYRDQILTIVSSELAPLYADDEKIITGSMVNNYVKQRVIPAPLHKRYAKDHLTHLMIVCLLKQVLPISQVEQLISLCHEQDVNMDSAYDEVARCLEASLKDRFSKEGEEGVTQTMVPTILNEGGQAVDGLLPTLLQASIGLVANKVYLTRLLALETRRGAA